MDENDKIKKFHKIINETDKNLWEKYIMILETSINYLKDNQELTTHQKIATTFVVKEVYLYSNNFYLEDITKIIDNFISYYKHNYVNYMNNSVIIDSEFERQLSFYYSYINKIKNA